MPKKRVTLAALTAAAIVVADRDGFEALTLNGVAGELDAAASTLYTHTDGLDGLKTLVAVAGLGLRRCRRVDSRPCRSPGVAGLWLRVSSCAA